jgi:hypothetical protein
LLLDNTKQIGLDAPNLVFKCDFSDALPNTTHLRSDLVGFRWDNVGITADFLLPDDAERIIRVTFNKPCIIRILDEMPLSTEKHNGPSQGLVPDHLAYRVEGSAFNDAQSEAWKVVNAPVTHYRFVTGWACMDVLSSGRPSLTVIERSPARSA